MSSVYSKHNWISLDGPILWVRTTCLSWSNFCLSLIISHSQRAGQVVEKVSQIYRPKKTNRSFADFSASQVLTLTCMENLCSCCNTLWSCGVTYKLDTGFTCCSMTPWLHTTSKHEPGQKHWPLSLTHHVTSLWILRITSLKGQFHNRWLLVWLERWA